MTRPIERLAAIEARAASASPGPWSPDDGCVFSQPLTDERWRLIVARLRGDRSVPHPDTITGETMGFVCSTGQQPNFEADESFIANARADVPFLAAALREAWAELDASREVLKSVEWAGTHADPYCSCCGAGAVLGHTSNCALAACLRGAK